MNIKYLYRYATLIALKGINAQKGRKYYIDCPVEHYKFADILAKELYKLGASYVHIEYNDSTKKYAYKYATDLDLLYFPPFEKEMYKTFEKEQYGRIVLTSPNYSLNNLSRKTIISKASKIKAKAISKYKNSYMENKLEWCIAALPSASWADLVFPKEKKEKRYSLLWDAIIKSVRADKDDYLTLWEKHNLDLKKHADYLNVLNIDRLHITSFNGTDITISLVDDYIFEGGTSFTPAGVEFDANMPTEEIFSMPHKDKVDGICYSTKPLFLKGEVINNFGLRFKNGKVVEIICANKNHFELLNDLINTDEGSSSLGEVALVSNSSPINASNLLFFNTLFDENASCHLALGQSYSTNMKNSENYSKEEMKQRGASSSIIHVDFMIGHPTTSITAITKDGKSIPIMKSGEFVI